MATGMGPLYCSEADVYEFALVRGAVPSEVRQATVDSPNSRMWVAGNGEHGLATGAVIRFRADPGGALPSPLVAGSTYYAIASDTHWLQVAASVQDAEDGTAIVLADAGDAVVLIVPPDLLGAIAKASRLLDDMLPTACVPLPGPPYNPTVRAVAAEMAGAHVLHKAGTATKPLTQVLADVERRVAKWSTAPVRGENAPQPADFAAHSSAALRSDWRRFGGLS